MIRHLLSSLVKSVAVPVAQRIARWTSNPKVVGSIPTRDDNFGQAHFSREVPTTKLAEVESPLTYSSPYSYK